MCACYIAMCSQLTVALEESMMDNDGQYVWISMDSDGDDAWMTGSDG